MQVVGADEVTIIHIFNMGYCGSDGLWSGEEENVVAHGKTTNVKENTLHGVIKYKGCMYSEAQRNHND